MCSDCTRDEQGIKVVLMTFEQTIRAIERVTNVKIDDAIPRGVYEATIMFDLGKIDKQTYHFQMGNTLRAKHPSTDVDKLLTVIELYLSYCV